VRHAALICIFLSFVGMIYWLNPTTYSYPVGELISEADRQEIVTHLYIGDNAAGPWVSFVDVPYGEEMWVGNVPAAKWFCGYCDLYGIPSDWSGPVYSGDAPVPVPPPPEPTPPPPGDKGK
jgi:hypothetical protein